MDGPSDEPDRNEARREKSGMGAAFLYVSFFGRAKKETRRAGAKPRI
jgi:hypothetical protein